MSALSQRGAAAQAPAAERTGTREGGDAGRALFGHAAELLAAAKAVEATARAPGTAPAVGPTLACIEASLGALAQASERLREHALQSTPGSSDDRRLLRLRSENSRRLHRLSAALEEARAAAYAADLALGDHDVPAFNRRGA
jgi:hypothetical protein